MLKSALPAALAPLLLLTACQPPPLVPPPPPNYRINPPAPVPPYGPDPQIAPQPPRPDPEPPVTTPGTYPTATATDNRMQVLSPYPPYNVIDLSDLPDPGSGQLARDPSNQKIFRIP